MSGKRDEIITSILRSIAAFVCFIAVSSLTSFIIQYFTAAGHDLLTSLKNYVVHIICTVGSILIFYSVELAFSTSDKYGIADFLERESKDVSLPSEIKKAFTCKRSLCEITVTHTLIAISAILGAFPYIGGMFLEKMPTYGYFPALVLTPICLICTLLAKYEAARHWKTLDHENNMEKITAPSWFIIRIITVILIYPTVLPLSPLLGYMIYSIGAIFVQMTVVMTAIGAVLALIALILLLWASSLIRGICKRRKFLKKLKQIAYDNGYTLCDISFPYRSFATSSDHCRFLLMLDGKSYGCVVISTVRKRTPLVFTSANDAHFLHRIGTKDHGITLRHGIEFFHPVADEKITIVNPSPKRVFAAEGSSQRVVYCSDRIWGFTVHDAESFLGAVERKCLDKNSAVSGK